MSNPQQNPPLRAAIIPVTPLQQNCTLLWCTETMKGAFVDPGEPRTIERLDERGMLDVPGRGAVEFGLGPADLGAVARDAVAVLEPHDAVEDNLGFSHGYSC